MCYSHLMIWKIKAFYSQRGWIGYNIELAKLVYSPRTTKIRRLAIQICVWTQWKYWTVPYQRRVRSKFLRWWERGSEAPKSEVRVTLLNTKAGWLLHQKTPDWQAFNKKGQLWILFQIMPLKGLIVIRPSYLFKGQAFRLGQILNLSLWPHVLWSK